MKRVLVLPLFSAMLLSATAGSHAQSERVSTRIYGEVFGSSHRPSDEVFFQANMEDPDQREFFRIPVDGSATPVEFDLPMTATDRWQVTPDGSVVLHLDGMGLHVTTIDGVILTLDLTSISPSSEAPLLLTPDGTQAIYQGQIGPDVRFLSVLTNGTGMAVQLDDAATQLATGCGLVDAQVSNERLVYYSCGCCGSAAQGLWSVPLDGSASPVRISTTAVEPTTNSTGWSITPDGMLVIYKSVGALHRAPIDGSASAFQLSACCEVVSDFVLSPDSLAVAYVEADGDLWTTAADGSGTPAQLATAVVDFAYRSAGDLILYTGETETPGLQELFNVPADASAAAAKLSGAYVADVDGFALTPSGSEALFRRAATLFTVPADGSGSATMVTALDPLPTIEFLSFSSSEERVVFTLAEPNPELPLQVRLYSTPLDGSQAPTLLNRPLDVQFYRIPPVPGRMVYKSFELIWSTSARGDTPVLLTPHDFALSFSLQPHRPSFYPDGEDIAYIESTEVPLIGNLLVTAVDGSETAQMVSSQAYIGYRTSSDSNYLVFRAFRFGGVGLSSASTTSLIEVDIGGPVPVGSDVTRFEVAQDSQNVVFMGDLDTPGQFELFSTPIGGAPLRTKLNSPLDPGHDVFDFVIDNTNQRVLYTAQQGSSAILLYSVPIDASAAPTTISTMGTGPVFSMQVSPDDSHVVYHRGGLYAAPLPSGTPLELNSPLVAGGQIESYQVTGNSQVVLYTADQDTDGTVELYAASISVSQLSQKISGSMTAGGNVISFTPHPVLDRIVYRADQDSDGTIELYRTTSTGAGIRKLSPPLVPAGNVTLAKLDPQSDSAIFMADAYEDEVFELFAAPLLGPRPARPLNGRLSPGGDVVQFDFQPGGENVYYRADQDLDEAIELYIAPLFQRADRASGPQGNPTILLPQR